MPLFPPERMRMFRVHKDMAKVAPRRRQPSPISTSNHLLGSQTEIPRVTLTNKSQPHNHHPINTGCLSDKATEQTKQAIQELQQQPLLYQIDLQGDNIEKNDLEAFGDISMCKKQINTFKLCFKTSTTFPFPHWSTEVNK
jgi:hypothetical protein